MGKIRSYKETTFSGKEYIAHYDEDGNKIGETWEEKKFSGETVTRHYDKDGNLVGESRNEKTFFGTPVIRHYDKDNNQVSESREGTSFSGKPILRHYGKDGYIGKSYSGQTLSGKDYVEYKSDDKRNAGGQSGAGFFGDGGAQTSSDSLSPSSGVPISAGEFAREMLVWLLGMLLSAAALIGMVLALLYASKNGGDVLEWMRMALAPALCPVAMAVLAIDCRKLGRKTPQGKALRRRLMIASFALFLALEIVFLIHTRPGADLDDDRGFFMFLVCWAPALVYTVLCGAFCRGKSEGRVMSEIYCFASSVYAAVVSVMEFMIMLASGAMDETMELILYLLPACAILGFVVFVLRKLLDGVFRLIAGFRAR